MASYKQFLHIFAFLFICMGISECRQQNNKFEIEVLKPYHTSEECNIRDLKAVSVTCNRRLDEFLAEDHTTCHVPGNGTILEYQCVEGTWKLSTGTGYDYGYHLRSRRFPWGLLFGAISGIVGLVKVIYCSEKYGNVKCEEREVEEKNLIAPKYTTCPPTDIQSLYTAGRKQKTAQVTWTDPAASDDEELLSNEQTCCNFKKGDQFTGLPGAGWPHTVTYTAKDNYGLSATCSFTFAVKYLTCDEPTTPSNGKKASCPDGYIYGGQCTFECDNGYEMVGSNTATCQQDETWDISPTCQKITCEAPFDIPNGNLNCDDPTYPFDDDCIFKCDDGFKLNGPSKMTCQADQTWSVDASQVSCVDDDSPIIDCQSPQVFYADRDSFGTSVVWTEPTATDNVDLNPSVVQQPGLLQGQTLTEGFHFVTYKATDSDGNSHPALSECTITLEVKVIKCSTGPTDALDVSRFMTYNCSDTSFYNGVSCKLGCDLNLPLNGTDLMTCERDGTTDKGVWSWGSGQQPLCEVVECPALDSPTHGAFTTDSVNARPLHVMLCNKGYDISAVGPEFKGRLSCQDSGEWFPLDAFPDCIVSILPWLNLPAELYYDGDCNDAATKDQIKQIVLDYLSGVQADIDQSICPNVDTCKVENLVVVCGDTSGRKRRSSSKKITKRQTGYVLVTWEIRAVFDQGNKTTMDEYAEKLDLLNEIKATIQDDVNNGDLSIPGFTLPSDAFQTDANPAWYCKPGYFVETGSVICKPCPPGTYLDSVTDTCEYCNVGGYMDHEGAIICDSCPEGYSTLSTGSKDISKCIRLCSPGYFSSSTLEPCSACPVGTYQHLKGQDGCLACPLGTATDKTSSVTIDDCHFFDIYVGQISQRTNVGTFSAAGTDIVSLSVWLKLQSVEAPNMSLYIADAVIGDIVTLNASDLVNVVIGTGSVIETNATLSSERWTHFMCTFDLASGALELYIDGELVVTDAASISDLSGTVSSGTIQILSNSKGILISGLVVYGRHFNSDDRISLSQTCAVASSDELFSMTNILSNIVQGIAVITPTNCDPVDECSDKPCGNHTCVNMVDDFECICHGGMTGDLCDLLPDYCQGHGCVHGDCISETESYTCNCTDGYTGVFCDTPPVNGAWSQWAEWSGCDVTCGGGTQSRIRSCSNPPPGIMGKECNGNDVETESCNNEMCPTCPQLERIIGTIVTCSHNEAENLEECNMTCVKGKEVTYGQRPFEKYWCGSSTNYKWMPINKVPECVSATKPIIFGAQASVSYTTPISESDKIAIASSVEQKVSGVGCVQSGKCNMTSSVSNLSRRKRRATTSTLTTQFAIHLTETGDLGVADYLTSGTETAAMTELLDALDAISDVIEFIQNNNESIFQVTVGGVDYVPESNSTNIVATVACPSGYAGAGGLCALCPAGTKLVNTACLDCEVGTYQPSTGQSACLSCPGGYTTPAYGARDVSECSVVSNALPTSPSDSDDDDDDDDNDDDDDKGDNDDGRSATTVIAVVAVLSSVAFICLIVAISLVLCKKSSRRRFRNNKTNGSFASLSMVRSESSLSNTYVNARTTFNTGNMKDSIPQTPQTPHPDLPPSSGAAFQEQPPPYDSHGFGLTPQSTKAAEKLF